MTARRADRRRLRRRGERAAIATFVAVLLLPTIGLGFGADAGAGADRTENRAPAAAPSMPSSAEELLALPGATRRWFDDHFAFRHSLIRANAWIDVRVLGVSPDTSVVLGDSGWVFYRGDGALGASRGDRLFSEPDLAAWCRLLESRRLWLAERGARYVFVVAPEKSTIYGRHLPRHLRPASDRTRLDQLVERLRRDTKVVVVDPRPALRRAARTHRVYHRTDTHWNHLGAWVAYREIFDAADLERSGERALELGDFGIRTRIEPGGDLARMLALPDVLEERTIVLEPDRPLRAPSEWILAHGRAPVRLAADGSERERLVMFRDSFGTALVPYLAEHFSAGLYLWQYEFDRELIETATPTLVIEEIAERRLMRPPPER